VPGHLNCSVTRAMLIDLGCDWRVYFILNIHSKGLDYQLDLIDALLSLPGISESEARHDHDLAK
jgi:hypothetical protein